MTQANEVTVRAYGPLNDFLPAHRRQVARVCASDERDTVKDLLEGLGVPHPEIDLILVNGESVSFSHAVRHGDRVAVFPRFMSLDVGPLSRVRPEPLDEPRFVADVHLGRLARHLRLVGLDTAYATDADDATLADLSAREGRILLTRDRGLLKRRDVTHGYFIREIRPRRQLLEVLRRFGPLDLWPLSRCARCNAALRDVTKADIDSALPPRTRVHYEQFAACTGCGRVYWKGAHWTRLKQVIEAARRESGVTSGAASETP